MNRRRPKRQHTIRDLRSDLRRGTLPSQSPPLAPAIRREEVDSLADRIAAADRQVLRASLDDFKSHCGIAIFAIAYLARATTAMPLTRSHSRNSCYSP